MTTRITPHQPEPDFDTSLDMARQELVNSGQATIRKWLNAHNAPPELWDLFDVTATLIHTPIESDNALDLMIETTGLIRKITKSM